jgi:hypothetical protein
LARRARFVSPALTVTGGMVNAGNAVTDATPTIRATVVDLQELQEEADLGVRVDNELRNFFYNANSGVLSLPGGRMKEGRHRVEITATTNPTDPQSLTTTKSWTFRVQ